MANRIEIIIDSVTTGLESGLKKTEHGLGRFKYAALGAGIAVAGGLAVGLEKSVKAAMHAQTANARLAQSFKDAGLNANKYGGQVDKLESSGRKLGFTDEQTVESLGSLVTATKSMTLASKDLATAQDLARFKHVDLADATKMLTMAMTGSQRAAKQLGITVSPVTKTYDALKATMGKTIDASEKMRLAQAKLTDKQLTGIAVVDAVKQHVEGQAEAYSKTAAGAIDAFHAQVLHLEVALGEKLLPALVATVNWINANWPTIAATIKRGWEQIRPTLVAFMDLAKGVVNVIRANWNTIGPIVRGVAAVIKAQVAVITAVIRTLTALLRGDWSGAWNAAKATVSAAVSLIVARVQLMKSLVVAAVRGVVAGVRGLAGAFLSAGTALASSLIHGIVSGLSGLAGAILRAIQGAVSSAVSSVHIPTPHVGFSHGHPTISLHALGGSVSGTGASIVGEKGPELFMPRSAGRIIPNNQLGRGGGGGTTTVQLVLPDGRMVAEWLIDPLRNAAQVRAQRTGRPAFG